MSYEILIASSVPGRSIMKCDMIIILLSLKMYILRDEKLCWIYSNWVQLLSFEVHQQNGVMIYQADAG